MRIELVAFSVLWAVVLRSEVAGPVRSGVVVGGAGRFGAGVVVVGACWGWPSPPGPKVDDQAFEKTMRAVSDADSTVRRQCVTCLQRRGPEYSVP